MIEYILDCIVGISDWLHAKLHVGHATKTRDRIIFFSVLILILPLIICGLPLALWQDCRKYIFHPLKAMDKFSLWVCEHCIEVYRDWLLTWLEPFEGSKIHNFVFVFLIFPAIILFWPWAIWALFRRILRRDRDHDQANGGGVIDEMPHVRVALRESTHNWRKEGF